MSSAEKILTSRELVARRVQWKAAGKCVVFTNGCFDLLHPGHLRTLERARALAPEDAGVLVVGLNSDHSVRALKGAGRPLMSERERAEVLAALACVDAVTIFDAPTPRELIQTLLPDVLAKGGDWEPDEIVGRAEVGAAGGKVVSLPYEAGYSTSVLIEKIIQVFGAN